MTYGRLKTTIKLFLVGGATLYETEEEMLAALDVAFVKMSGKVIALKLLTINKDNEIMRKAYQGEYYTRMPKLPQDDRDVIDIDHELCVALAMMIAAEIDHKKSTYLLQSADIIIADYGAKLREYRTYVDAKKDAESNYVK